ncbi:tail tape measure protein [Rhizobium phage RHph_X3_2]|nr:tail tape measure protein [Rhizobium phage RHph_X3_2]
MDVAALGVEVHSTNVTKVTADLNQLSVAAAKAEANAAKLAKQKLGVEQSYAAARAAQNMAKATELAARAEGNLSKEQMATLRNERQLANAHAQGARAKLEEARAADVLARAEHKLAQEQLRAAQADRDRIPQRPANQNVAGRENWGNQSNPANIAAQFQDIGVTAAMGMNPLMIALQQGTQLSMAMGGGIKALGAALAMCFTATTLLTIGVVALVAALIQWVDWAGLAAKALDWLADNLQMIAPYAVAAAAALALIYAPAIVGGIISLIALISRVGLAATVAGAQMAAAWVVASGPIGWLITAVGLVLAAMYVFRDEINQVFGVDVVNAAKTGANYVIGAFVAAYHDLEFIWANFPNIIGAAAVGAANLAIKAMNGLMQMATDHINQWIKGINQILSLAGMGTIGEISVGSIGQIENTQFEGLKSSLAERNAQIDLDMNTDYVGGAISYIQKGADAASGKLRELSKLMTEVDDKTKGKGKGRAGGAGGKTDEDKFGDIVDGANRRIAELQAERDALGLTAEQAARLRYETELLNQAQQKNIALSPQQRAELGSLAAEMAKLEIETKRAKETMDFAKDITKGFFGDLRSGLAEGKSLWEAFGDAAMNVLDKIVDKLMNDVIDALFQTSSATGGLFGGGGGGGGGGILGGLFGWLFSAKGNAFGRGGVHKFAKGGAFTNQIVSSPTLFKFAKGAGMMGEAGPEAIMPLSRDANGRLGVTALDARRGGGGNMNVHVTSEVFMNEDGQWEARVRDISQEESEKTTKAGLNAFSQKELPTRVEQINKNPRRRG